MKESISNALRWISIPFVFVAVLFIVHALAVLLNGGTISSMNYNSGPIPVLPFLAITFFAGFVSSGASIYACVSIAPSHKKAVAFVLGGLLILLGVIAIIYRLISKESGLELWRSIIDNVGTISGSIMTTKLISEEDYE